MNETVMCSSWYIIIILLVLTNNLYIEGCCIMSRDSRHSFMTIIITAIIIIFKPIITAIGISCL